MARPGLEPGSLSIRETSELLSHMADFISFPHLTALKVEVLFSLRFALQCVSRYIGGDDFALINYVFSCYVDIIGQ